MPTVMDKTSSVAIPSRFGDLAPLVEKWAFPTENQRSAVRWGASASEFEVFYSETMPRLGELLELLSHDAPDKLPPPSPAIGKREAAQRPAMMPPFASVTWRKTGSQRRLYACAAGQTFVTRSTHSVPGLALTVARYRCWPLSIDLPQCH